MHSFAEKLAQGEAVERQLDAIFEQRYIVRLATRAQQRQGIDRLMADRDGNQFAMEYKADWRAAETGNAFIETVSVDTAGKPGWARTSKADWLVYAIPPHGIAYGIPMSVVRAMVPEWAARYPTRPARNSAYSTHGICVPVPELVRFSEWEVGLHPN